MTDHAEAMGADEGLERCPLMPTYGAPSVLFTRGRGSELWDAFRVLDMVEHAARITHQAVQLGEVKVLKSDQVDRLMKVLNRLDRRIDIQLSVKPRKLESAQQC